MADLDPGDAPEGMAAHERRRGRRLGRRPLAGRHRRGLELIDPTLSSERCSTGCSTSAACACSAASTSQAKCSCSRDGVEAMLRSFSQDDRDHMVENGTISVTCEFCSASYVFDPAEEVGAASVKPPSRGRAPQFRIS